jgi:hypothetical protein
MTLPTPILCEGITFDYILSQPPNIIATYYIVNKHVTTKDVTIRSSYQIVISSKNDPLVHWKYLGQVYSFTKFIYGNGICKSNYSAIVYTDIITLNYFYDGDELIEDVKTRTEVNMYNDTNIKPYDLITCAGQTFHYTNEYAGKHLTRNDIINHKKVSSSHDVNEIVSFCCIERGDCTHIAFVVVIWVFVMLALPFMA